MIEPTATPPRGANGRIDRLTWVVSGLLLIAVFYTLYFGYEFFMPAAAAIILALVLSPVVAALARVRVPRPVGALLVLAILVATLGVGFLQLATPAAEWIENAPRALEELERKLLPVKRSVEQVQEAAQEVEKATQVGPTATTGGRAEPVPVVVSPRSMLDRVFGGFQQTVLHLGFCVVFAYFLLAYADVFQEKLINALPRVQQKKQAMAVTRQIANDVSGYLFAITLINIGLGATVGIGLHLVGLPNALLWGVMVAILNYIPYFGFLVGIAVIFLVGLTNFETLTEALFGPAIYLLCSVIESEFLTPALLGRRLVLNPAIIFLVVVFWGWFWGIAGALLAVPFLIVLKGISNYFAPLATFGELLSGRRTAENGNGAGEPVPEPARRPR